MKVATRWTMVFTRAAHFPIHWAILQVGCAFLTFHHFHEQKCRKRCPRVKISILLLLTEKKTFHYFLILLLKLKYLPLHRRLFIKISSTNKSEMIVNLVATAVKRERAEKFKPSLVDSMFRWKLWSHANAKKKKVLYYSTTKSEPRQVSIEFVNASVINR